VLKALLLVFRRPSTWHRDLLKLLEGFLLQFSGAKLKSSRCFNLKEDMRIKQGRYRDKSARGSVLGAIELLYG
jgi:hypothetical protein